MVVCKQCGKRVGGNEGKKRFEAIISGDEQRRENEIKRREEEKKQKELLKKLQPSSKGSFLNPKWAHDSSSSSSQNDRVIPRKYTNAKRK